MHSRVNSRVSSGFTACVAVAAAGVIAITPVVSSTPTPPRVVDAQIALTGVSDFTGKSPDALFIMAAERLAQQPQQIPFIPGIAALAVVAGDNDRLYTVARSIIDAPLYVADPLIYAAAASLPVSQGGNPEDPAHSAIWTEFRDGQLYGLRQDLDGAVADALGVDAKQDANYAYYLSNKLMESAFNVASLPVLQAASLIPLAEAMVSGDKVAIYKVVRDYIDGPQWAIDPAIEGIAEALPESLGGGTNHDPRTSQGNPAAGIKDDGALMQFRNKEMLGVRNSVRVAAAKALGVDVNDDGNLPTSNLNRAQLSAGDDEPGADAPKVNKLKPHVTSLNAALGDAKDRAAERRDKAKANADKVVKKVREAAGKTAKKLSPKKSSED